MGFNYTELTSGQSYIPLGWRVDKVKEVAKVNETSIQKSYNHEWIEYIDIASVEKGSIKSVEELPLNAAPSRAKRIVRDHDILIATVRPNLEHYVFIKKAKLNTIASTGFAVITAKQVEPRFLYYYLTTKPFTNYLTRIADSHTSAYPSFNPDVIENADLILPPLPEQKAIASILGALDDKIELNRKMNETLEAMARAIFKSCFTYPFEGLKYLLNGEAPSPLPSPNGRGCQELTGEGELALVDSPLGKIPKGWMVRKIRECCSRVENGGTPRRD